MLEEKAHSRFVHEANVAKYQRILRTHLTDYERSFVQRRLAQELSLLRQLAKNTALESKPIRQSDSEMTIAR